MISRLKSIIAHNHDTKLLGEDGEDATAGWGTRPSPKAKPVEKDFGDTLTTGLGNKPNPEKDLVMTYSWGNRPNPEKDLTLAHG